MKSQSSTTQLDDLLERFAHRLSPDAVRSAVEHVASFVSSRAPVLTSGLGMEGCALIDMLSRSTFATQLRVVFLDTDFHFPETLELFGRLEARYPNLRFERVHPTLGPAAQAAREGEELWLRDPDRCCALRKIEPLAARLRSADLWLSALRRSQASSRAGVPVFAATSRFAIPKLAPLVAWSRDDVWRYVQAHDVPFHAMHLRSYPTVGCRHCTMPVPGVGPGDYSRDGRWSSAAKTECGLHQTAAAAQVPSALATTREPTNPLA